MTARSPRRAIAITAGAATVAAIAVGIALRDDVQTRTPDPFEDTSTVAARPETPLETASRHFAAVPDSVLMRRGACPFECCVYGEWRAESRIPVLTSAEAGADTAYALENGDAFTADQGFVQIVGPAIIAVTDTVRDVSVERVQLVPGDTLVVLDYAGEGHFNMWHSGRVLPEVGGFWGAEVDSPRGAYYGNYRKAWWVHTSAPAEGWFRADSTFRYAGADACAG